MRGDAGSCLGARGIGESSGVDCYCESARSLCVGSRLPRDVYDGAIRGASILARKSIPAHFGWPFCFWVGTPSADFVGLWHSLGLDGGLSHISGGAIPSTSARPN